MMSRSIRQNKKWLPIITSIILVSTLLLILYQTNITFHHISTLSKAPSIPNPHPQTPLPCASYLIYDKPPKTGSSAITRALKSHLRRSNASWAICPAQNCSILADKICAGLHPPQNLILHIVGHPAQIPCLRSRHNYYAITSIRHPAPRWESAFLYNQAKKACHFGQCYNQSSYAQFMNQMPTCAFLSYFDNRSKTCDSHIDARIAEISSRYDEIIDLYRPLANQGPLARAIAPILTQHNRSPRPDTDFRQPYDETRLNQEIRFYHAMQARRKQLLAMSPPRRQLCPESRLNVSHFHTDHP